MKRSKPPSPSGGVVDLCSGSSSSADDDRPRYRGYATYDVGAALDDSTLRGRSKIVTLETARQAVRLVAQFARDEAAAADAKGGPSVTFARSLFDPLWQRLKEQGGGRDEIRWRYERTRNKLSTRSWAFVPPGSKLGTRGKPGVDFYLSEEHVAHVVLSEISAIKGVSDLYAKNAHYFLLLLPILERAVKEGVEYKVAREDRKGPRGAGSCYFNSFGIDCDLMGSSDVSPSEDEKSSSEEGEKKACAKVGNDEAPCCEDEVESNLSGVEPKDNMPIDILDKDSIWNIGKIIQVSYESANDKKDPSGQRRGCGDSTNDSTRTCYVTIHYDGWGKKWEEIIPYPNARLARIFTYTKKVKCFVRLLTKSMRGLGIANDTRNWTDVWPCRVSFRVPHPNHDLAADDLRAETHVFIEPYLAKLLPPTRRQQYVAGGKWFPATKLVPWEDMSVDNHTNSPAGELIHDNTQPAILTLMGFCEAYQSAQSDWIKGQLPPDALSKGSLLKDEYRIHHVGGSEVGGVKYSGSFHSDKNKTQLAFAPNHTPLVLAPLLPHTIPITDSAIPPNSVRWLPHSKRWAGVLCVAGNDIFLGSFKRESEAGDAVRLALAKSRVEAGCGKEGKVEALFHTPIAAIVASFERDQKQSRFCLQDWMAEHCINVQHANDSRPTSGQDDACSFMVNLKTDGCSSGRKRRKSAPKRLHKK